MYSECIVCNKQLNQPNSDILYSTIDSFLPFMEIPITFYEAINIFSNFADLNIDTASAFACDNCFMLANSAVCFQQMCQRAFCTMQANQCNENVAEDNKDLIEIVEKPITNCTSELHEGIVHVELPPNEINIKAEVNPERAEVQLKISRNRRSRSKSIDSSEERRKNQRKSHEENSKNLSNSTNRYYLKRTTQFVTKSPHLPRKVKRKRMRVSSDNDTEQEIEGRNEFVKENEANVKCVDKDPKDNVVIENNKTEDELSDQSDEEFRPNKKRVRKTKSRAQNTKKTKVKEEGQGEKTEKQSTPQKSEAELSGYFCEICGKHYSKSKYSAFRSHRRDHRNANKFKCELCDKTFSQNSNLKRHMNIHEGIRPYRCKLCGIAFFHDATLKVHMATHTGTRDYKCDECGLGFVIKSRLKRHLVVHTREKPSVCPECGICGMTFSQGSSLRRHMRTLHNIDTPDRRVLPKAELAKKKLKEKEMEVIHETKQAKEETEVETAADSITS